MKPPNTDLSTPPAVFLERQSYRRRRLMDAAKLLPLLGVLLFAVPLLWPGPETGPEAGAVAGQAGAGRVAVRMSDAIQYIFLVWAALIGASALFGLSARRWSQSDSPHRPPGGPDPD